MESEFGKKCQCGVDIVKKTRNKNEIKIRSKILVLGETGFVAICRNCGNEIIINTEINKAQEFIGSAESA